MADNETAPIYASWPFINPVNPLTDLGAFVSSLGLDPMDDARLIDTTLYVNNGDQDALLAAYAAFDFAGQSTAQAWIAVRTQRTLLLEACDWTQCADAPATIDHAAWATYRQALRDVPQNNPDPTNVAWPAPPALPQTAGVSYALAYAVKTAAVAQAGTVGGAGGVGNPAPKV